MKKWNDNRKSIGVDPYHFCETGDVVCTVTSCVGQSTAIGPKVATISKTNSCKGNVIGTIDASIYSKNNFQDNSKYIIHIKGKSVMQSPIECFKKIIGTRKDAKDIIATAEACLKVVQEGIMSIVEAVQALEDLNEQIDGCNKCSSNAYESVAEAIRDINRDAPHQQDQINCQDEATRTLSASTHGAASHLTKTCVETEDDEGNEVCIVRRLTPTETSRLQGFPDDYTKIDGPDTSDSPQFKSHGNSWATPCANNRLTRIEMELRRLGKVGTIDYATVCSGIEAHSVAVRNLDWKSLFFSEIEPFPCRVLACHYPTVPNLGDMTQIHYDTDNGVITNKPEEGYTLPKEFNQADIQEIPFSVGDIDVFSGGTPCFTEGHQVWTEDGEKNIEDIKIGDKVYSHKGNLCSVVKVGYKIATVCRVKFCEGTTFKVTKDHPFLVMNEKGDGTEWMPISKVSKSLSSCAKWNPSREPLDYHYTQVQSVENIEIHHTVYNIEVDGDHSYICNGFCVHNCTDVSVAGKRLGMAEDSGTRSSLAWHFQRIIDETKPMFTLWENVPGCFSSNGGADFIWFVNKCAESGYAMAWRVLDAQYVMTEEFPRAVPQRRRRVWLVGYKGNDWRVPARICFDLEKDLTSNPPERIPGIGFKDLSAEGREVLDELDKVIERNKKVPSDEHMFGLTFESDDGRNDLLKVSRMIDFSEMPEENDFSKVPMTEILTFAKKVGEPGYIGSVFRTDKKKSKKVEETIDLFSMLSGEKTAENEVDDIPDEEEWEGAEKITPAILENIGNSGILANGRICTMKCHEWTSGIQLSPKTQNAWDELVRNKEWVKANELLPEAYNGTVCGLSDVLEDNPDEKYNLSWRACFGILRRAESRGKELPEALHIALISTIRENAGIVKWYAINGRDTKKKETDVSEKEAARICFDKYISSKVSFDDVVPEEPKKRTSEEEEADDDELNEEEISEECIEDDE